MSGNRHWSVRYKTVMILLSDTGPRFEAGTLLGPVWRPDNLATAHPVCLRHFFLSRKFSIYFCLYENAKMIRDADNLWFSSFLPFCFCRVGDPYSLNPDQDRGFICEFRYPDPD